MPPPELSGPDLAGVVADADAAGLPYVVIGGFSVIFHGYVRATIDSDILVPDGQEAEAAVVRFCQRVEATQMQAGGPVTEAQIIDFENLRVSSRHGIVDIIRGGAPPLDYETVAARAETVDWDGQVVRVAALASVVGFKRLAGRAQDRLDLGELEAIYGELPIEPIPGLDS